MSEQPLSIRAYNSAVQMYQADHRGPPPTRQDFAHLDAATATAATHEPSPVPATEPAAPGWDVAAFDALPPDTRAGVLAGTAFERGRGFLELEAERALQRPADVHLYLSDAARYVDAEGRVNRDAIRNDLRDLTRQRPELSRYGHGPGQVGARPDERRHAPQDGHVGAAGAPGVTLASRVAAVAAVMNGRG